MLTHTEQAAHDLPRSCIIRACGGPPLSDRRRSPSKPGGFGPYGGPDIDCAGILSQSLPSLRSLRLRRSQLSNDTIAGLLGAAGPHLTALDISQRSSSPTAAVRLISKTDYPWLSSLQELTLHWTDEQAKPFVTREVMTMLSCISALTDLQINGFKAYDDLLVRLMAAAEHGTLPPLRTLELPGFDDYTYRLANAWNNYMDQDVDKIKYRPHPRKASHGALLLLALWLKRRAKKALQGGGRAGLWEVVGLEEPDDPRNVTGVAIYASSRSRRHGPAWVCRVGASFGGRMNPCDIQSAE